MYRLAFIGFGTVGQGAVEILRDKAAMLRDRYGFEAQVVAVTTLRKGGLYQRDGLNLDALLTAIGSGSLAHYPEAPDLIRDMDALATIQHTGADVIIEVSYTDLSTAEPALSYCRAAFDAGKSVITANKGPIALAFAELTALAKSKRAFFGYEGTVMSGQPTLRLASEALAGCTITGVRGILNGTTNYMLTQMEAGRSYADVLSEAQRLGYAEADPTGDVEGYDSAGKLAILANVILGGALTPSEVDRTGITMLTTADIEAARLSGERWKLICSASVQPNGRITAQVRPERLPLSDPLAIVNGVTNAITYDTDLLGPVTLIGAGAGRSQTGFAIVADLLAMHRESHA